MKTVKERLFKSLDRDEIGREIEEELRFHLDLLTDEHFRQDMPLAEAKDAALRRFGDIERIKGQCVEISRRNRPAIRALKLFLILVFLGGVLLRIFSPEYHVTHVADILIAVGILGRVLLYLRSWTPAIMISNPEASSPLGLNDHGSIAAYDQTKRTPVERLISD